jgi:hypothetical protein
MRLLESVPALFLVGASAAVMLGTIGLAMWDGFTPGARFFPVVVGTVGLVLAAVLLWQQWRGTDAGTVDRPDAPALARVGLTVLALTGLAAGAPVIGLVPMLGVFALFVLLVVLRQRVASSLTTAAVIVVGVHLIFVRWLAVPLPAPFGL